MGIQRAVYPEIGHCWPPGQAIETRVYCVSGALKPFEAPKSRCQQCLKGQIVGRLVRLLVRKNLAASLNCNS